MGRSYYVRVAGWSNSRQVLERDGKVSFEVALSHDHCPTCAARVRYITQQLANRNVQYSWKYYDGSGSFVELDAPGQGMPTEKYLSELLGLNIR